MSIYSENLLREVTAYVAKNGRIVSPDPANEEELSDRSKYSAYLASDEGITLISASRLEIKDDIVEGWRDYYATEPVFVADRSISVDVVFSIYEKELCYHDGRVYRPERTIQKHGVATVDKSLAEVLHEIAGPVEVTF